MNTELKTRFDEARKAWEAAAELPEVTRKAWDFHLNVLDSLITQELPGEDAESQEIAAQIMVSQLRLFTELVRTFKDRGHHSLAGRVAHYALAYYSEEYSALMDQMPEPEVAKLVELMTGAGKTQSLDKLRRKLGG